ncbi:MAG: hypothetical protein JWM12_2396 [Ilumatobacteraceae bacterium]|nr:hypothetical protein [Ilumatobacteraceae bacterium]
MSKQRIFAPAAVLLAITLGACGSDGGGKASFSDQLQEACRTVARGLRDVDQPTSLDDFRTSADDASSVFQAGVVALKKLKAPSAQSSDFKALQSNMNDEIDLFDQISSAAKKGDDKTVTTKISSLKKLDNDNSDLADSLDASSCAFTPVFTAGPQTTTTEPVDTTPVTDAPTTLPATTVPATTLPPATTVPVTTAAPVTTAPVITAPTTATAGDNKTIIHLAAEITPKGDYTFVDSDENTVTLIQTALALDPVMAAQPGSLFGVDVIVNDIAITRVFGFVPDGDTLAPGSVEAVESTLGRGAPVTPATIAGITGGTFTSSGNLFFVAEKGGTMVIVVGKDQNSLETGFGDFVEAVGN